jgi:hypothetical protein
VTAKIFKKAARGQKDQANVGPKRPKRAEKQNDKITFKKEDDNIIINGNTLKFT